jgi:hypothetical protein
MSTPLLIAAAAALLLAAGSLTFLSLRRRRQVRRAAAALGDRLMLVYDDRGCLVFHSSGLVLFDPNALRAFRKLPDWPGGLGSADEVVIDGNRYRYRCQNLDLPLERRGTAVLLEYIGSINA